LLKIVHDLDYHISVQAMFMKPGTRYIYMRNVVQTHGTKGT
jgi:hypothetical protein